MLDILNEKSIAAIQRLFEEAEGKIAQFATRCMTEAGGDGPAKFMIQPDGHIDITFADADITASPRLVRVGSHLIPEWTVVASNHTRSVELWRFYLDRDGLITEEIDDEGRDGSNRENGACGVAGLFREFIVGKIIARLFDSSLYARGGPLQQF